MSNRFSEKIEILLTGNGGKLPSHSSVGGYGIFYVDNHGGCYCPECANQDFDGLVDYDANWEDPTLFCDGCSERIPSEYAEDEWETIEREADQDFDSGIDILLG